MKVYKMVLHYGAMFTIPTAIAYYYWDPKSDEEIRKDIEAKVKPDAQRRLKNQAKYRALLLQREGDKSEETQKQLEQVTNFTPPSRHA